jgi:hypothetical protein
MPLQTYLAGLRARYSDYPVFLVVRPIGAIWYTRPFDTPFSSTDVCSPLHGRSNPNGFSPVAW